MPLLGQGSPFTEEAGQVDRWGRSILGGNPEEDPSILGYSLGPDPYTEAPTIPVKEATDYQKWLFGLGIPGYQFGGPDPFEYPELYPEWNPDPELVTEVSFSPAEPAPRLLWPLIAAIGLVIAAREGIL